MIRPAPEDLDGDDGFFDLAVPALQMLFNDEPQKSGQTLVARESSACQHPLQLPPRGKYLGFPRGRHVSSIPLVFSSVRMYETPSNTPGLVLTAWRAHR